ncbi:hypothetical protein LINPERHAP2_LOCUS5155 [Linum perenne]
MQTDTISNPRCPVIAFSEEEVLSFYKPWSKALVVKVLEKAFTFPVVRRRLESLWARSGQIQVSDMANNFFLVRFSKDEDYQRALFDGPCWLAVERIGNHIGKTVRLDLATSEGARARYARVCVEVDLSRPLLGKYVIEDNVYLVEYESLDNICYSCGMYGHKEETCKLAVPSETVVPPINGESSERTVGSDGNSGSWMSVKRRQRKPSVSPETTPQPKQSQGSRFDVLGSEPDLEEPSATNAGKAPTPAKEASPDPVQLAESLKQVLDKALKSKVLTGKGQTKGKVTKSTQKPLSDVTNLPGKKKELSTKKAPISVDNVDGLFSVPVMFENPVFKSSGTKPKTKGKAKSASNALPPGVKAPLASKVKRFGPKISASTCSQHVKTSSIGEPSKVGGWSGGRHPDSQ